MLPVYRCVSVCYLSCGPGGALADIGHTEAETVGAAEQVTLLQVVETWFTQITVSSHHIYLRRREQVRHQSGQIKPDGNETFQ